MKLSGIIVPQYDFGIKETISQKATIARWTKKRGDTVEPNEMLVEIEIGKEIFKIEIPALVNGTLKRITPEGTNVFPGEIIGLIEV